MNMSISAINVSFALGFMVALHVFESSSRPTRHPGGLSKKDNH
jgi:hypothetical protein